LLLVRPRGAHAAAVEVHSIDDAAGWAPIPAGTLWKCGAADGADCAAALRRLWPAVLAATEGWECALAERLPELAPAQRAYALAQLRAHRAAPLAWRFEATAAAATTTAARAGEEAASIDTNDDKAWITAGPFLSIIHAERRCRVL
jgi:hypothetical protein